MENVPTFQYLGRPLDQTDDNWPAVAKHHAYKVGLGQARDTTSTGGGRKQVVGKFLQGGGAGNSIVWVGNVGPFGVNGKEARGDAHGVPANDHREEREAIRR